MIKQIVFCILALTGTALSLIECNRNAGDDLLQSGPDSIYINKKFINTSVFSSDIDEMNKIQDILSSYYYNLPSSALVPGNYDCSKKSEIVWRVLQEYGYDVRLLSNQGYYNGEKWSHMFTGVFLSDGVVIVETTYSVDHENRLGVVLLLNNTEDIFYQHFYEFDTPRKYRSATHPDIAAIDVMGYTQYTPLSQLPILRTDQRPKSMPMDVIELPTLPSERVDNRPESEISKQARQIIADHRAYRGANN